MGVILPFSLFPNTLGPNQPNALATVKKHTPNQVSSHVRLEMLRATKASPKRVKVSAYFTGFVCLFSNTKIVEDSLDHVGGGRFTCNGSQVLSYICE